MNIKTILISIFLFLLLSTTASATVLPDAFQGYYNQSFVDADITDFEKALVGNYTDVKVSIPDAVGVISSYPKSSYMIDAWEFSESANYTSIMGVTGTPSAGVEWVNTSRGIKPANGSINFGSTPVYDNFSIVFWLSAYEWNQDFGEIVKISNGGGWPSNDNEAWTLMTRDDPMELYLVIGGDGVYDAAMYPVPTTNEFHMYSIVVENGTYKLYYNDDGAIISDSYTFNMTSGTFNLVLGSGNMNIVYDRLIYYNTALTPTDISAHYTEISGTAARTLPNGTWTPVVDGEADLPVDSTVKSVQVVNTEETATSDVTISALVTDNVTLTSETLTGNDYAASLSHVVSENVTSGTISFTPTLLSNVYIPALSSTNVNGTFDYDGTEFEIYTGALDAGDTETYNLSGSEPPRYSINGTVYNADNLVPVSNALVSVTDTSATTDADGFYTLDGFHNDSYVISVESESYETGYKSITIAGANETGVDILLEPASIRYTPITMYYLLIGLLFFFVLMTFRGVKEDGVYGDNLIFGLITIIHSFYLSKISINGTVAITESFVSSTDRIITDTTTFINPAMSTFFELIGIVFVFVFAMMVYNFIQERRLLDD